MGNLLFSTKGRITSAAAMKGMLILGVLAALISLAPMVSLMGGSMIMLLGFILLIYPIIAVFINGHMMQVNQDGFQSLFSFFLLLLRSILGWLVSSNIGVSEKEAYEAAMEGIKGSTDVNEMLATMNEYGKPYFSKVGIPSAIVNFLAFPVTAFISNFILKRDDHENQFGPAS